MPERLLVVGGDAAGMAAASQARRRRGPDDLEIVAVERGTYTSYSACGIPYWVGGDVDGPDALIMRTPQSFRDRYAIDARTRTEAVGIDLDRGEVRVRSTGHPGGAASDGSDGRAEEVLGFDQLVIATGSDPIRPSLPGVDADGIHGVQTLDDGVALRRDLDDGVAHAVVVGGGYIGVEMAEAMVHRGVNVTLVERAAEPMSTLDPDMGRLVRAAMEGSGIIVRSAEEVTGFGVDRASRVRAVVTASGEIPADLVILGIGVRPNTGVVAGTGITLGRTGGITTDRRGRVDGFGHVWAAGDCTETYDLVSRRPVHVPLGTHANKQGRVVGINIGGGYATFPGVVRTAISKVCDLEIARTGLREQEATEVGLDFVTVTVRSTTRAGYFPGSADMTIKLVAERGSGRLLGAQIVGGVGSAKRIDALAVALWTGMTVEEMAGLDLAYAPPFAPVWDPVLIAARKAIDAVESDRPAAAPAGRGRGTARGALRDRSGAASRPWAGPGHNPKDGR